ncbi:carboxymuconolactone decarboxylase family protein [Acinetobacter baumannii]
MQNSLSEQQQAIIPIAAYAANGDLAKLSQSLKDGLDLGLTIAEIKEVLVQTYAYAGFPRSLNALTTFMQVLEQRKESGIRDIEGKTNSTLPKDYQALLQGTQNHPPTEFDSEYLVKGALFDFAPAIDEYLKAHLFGDIFSRDVLNWQDREIATLSMLSALEGVDSQLQSHLNIAKTQGVSSHQFENIQKILAEKVSLQVGQRFQNVLTSFHNQSL